MWYPKLAHFQISLPRFFLIFFFEILQIQPIDRNMTQKKVTVTKGRVKKKKKNERRTPDELLRRRRGAGMLGQCRRSPWQKIHTDFPPAASAPHPEPVWSWLRTLRLAISTIVCSSQPPHPLSCSNAPSIIRTARPRPAALLNHMMVTERSPRCWSYCHTFRYHDD